MNENNDKKNDHILLIRGQKKSLFFSFKTPVHSVTPVAREFS
jgi:hypothetical protein